MNRYPATASGGFEFWPSLRLTWDGAEFLDGIRDDSSWAKVKNSIANTGLNIGFATIKVAIKTLIAKSLGG